MMASEMEMPCCFRCYHVYKDVCEAAIGNVLECPIDTTKCVFPRAPWLEKCSLYNYFRAKKFRPFSEVENIFTTKKMQITVSKENSKELGNTTPEECLKHVRKASE